MNSALYFALALAVTLALEGAVCLPLLLRGGAYFRAVFVLANAATNVALNFAIGLIGLFAADGESAVYVTIAVGEAIAIAAEFFIFRAFVKSKTLFAFVLCANAVSAVAGTFLLHVVFL